MKDSVLNILKLILVFTIFLSPLIAMFLIVFNADWFNALHLVFKLIIISGVVGLTAAVFIFIPKLRFLDVKLTSFYEKDEIKFEKWDEKNKKDIESLSIDKTKYVNITKIYSQLNRIKGSFFIIPSLFMLIYAILRSEQYNIAITFFLLTTAVLVYNYFGRIIKISPEGIRSASLLRNQLIKWDKIKTIGISSFGITGKSGTVDSLIWVYVSARELKSKHHLTSGEESKGYIAFKFRAKMIHHILCYYDKEVINLHNVKRWRRYMKKYGITSKQEEV